jgi:hypothetical protein
MKEEYLEDLAEIRQLMERSSRFISLSGFSGILIGLYALAGVFAAYYFLGLSFTSDDYFHLSWDESGGFDDIFYMFFYLDAAAVLILSLITAWYFTSRRARKLGVKAWDSTSRRMAINLMIPLFTGGIFSMLLIYHAQLPLVPGSMLVFYGLALVNCSKYTLDDIRHLGLIEIGLGLLGLFFTGYGLLFWATGFGLMHLVYGIFMYNKYERQMI